MTHKQNYLSRSIDRAAQKVGSVWPLHSFVTANPLAGLEDQPFHQAVAEAEQLFGGRGYPHPALFQRAWEDGQIDPEVLTAELEAHGIYQDPDAVLDEMAAEPASSPETDPATEAVDRILSKWLTAFLDQGNAEWPMPNREQGFYDAWRGLAPYDDEVPSCDDTSDLPETPVAAIEAALSDHPQGRWETIFEHQLASLPGWTGFIKQRTNGDGDPWQSTYPISLTEYLAVRLTLADLLDAPIEPDEDFEESTESDEIPLPEIWLRAWEKTHRDRLVESVSYTSDESASGENSQPAAQLVFCIDTRSEIIRRHIEAAGPYETHGYAGFFGIPMRYQGYDSDVAIDACPPIVDPQHFVTDRPDPHKEDGQAVHDQWTQIVTAGRKHLKTLKNNVAAAFTFVEGAGSAYGAAMATRTLLPSVVYDATKAVDRVVPSPAEFCTPALDRQPNEHDHGSLPRGMTLEEKVTYAETAFDLMGWEEFARLVVFTGHASQTTNNPFGSSLDCGACAGNPGGPSARVLATICNDEDVKSELRERGFEIPADTVFLAAEHNTTTDEITVFDSEVPASHQDDLERLRDDLTAARAGATAERTKSMTGETGDSVRETQRRATDWAETRPEWGLASNASFVIGPRELTKDENLHGRTFLHSYDWSTDPEGGALEAIMTGPLVVTQWINNQYYFATVDNAVYGSGSKVTQNPVGNVGVFQGNGGDLMTGLPLQSLYADSEQEYHQPLRLTALIHAPVEHVSEILRRHEHLVQLLDNGWMRLTVVDPEQDNTPFHYEGDLEWEPTQSGEPPAEKSVVVGETAD